MGWAPGFAGGSTRFLDNVATGETIIGVAFGRGHGMGAKGLLHLNLRFDFLRKFGTEFDRVDRAILDALSAGDAILDGDFATVIRCHGFIGFEFLDRTKTKASASTAIANRGGISFAKPFD